MNDGVFVTDGLVAYQLEELTPEQAADFGCPGATHIVTGRTGHIVGSVTQVTGRLVRVRGWTNRRGYRSIFTPWGAPDNGEPFRGWVAE